MAGYLKIALIAVLSLLVLSLFDGPAGATDKQPLPLSVQRVLFEAQTMVGEKRYGDARRRLEDYRREKERTHYLIEFSLGDIRLMTKAYAQAAQAYRKALKLEPDFAPAWMNLGKTLYELGDYPASADCFHRAYRTAADPHPERLYYSAAAYLMAEMPQQGLAVFTTLVETHATDIKLEWKPTLVQLYLDLEKAREALPVIEELAAESTGSQRMQWQETLLGQYLLLGKTDQALAYARELTRTAPTVPRWWKARSHILLQQSDHEMALEALMIYAKLTDLNKTEQRLLADLNLQVGIPSRAAHYYRDLANDAPDAEVITRLAHTLRMIDRPAEALEQIDRFLKSQPSPNLLWMKGELLYEMKRYPAAADTFRLCTQDRSQTGRAWLMAGYASWRAQDLLSAKEAFKRASTYPEQKKSALAALKAMEAAPAESGS